MPYQLAGFSGQREIFYGISIFLLSFCIVFIVRYHRINNENAILSNDSEVLLLYQRISLSDLPVHLDSLGIKYNRDHLQWTGQLFAWDSLAQGRYEIKGQTSNKEFLRKLVFGIQDPVNVLIPSGVTENTFITRVSKQLQFDEEDLIAAISDTIILGELEIDEINLFGRMLPNTYQLYWTSSPRQFLSRMLTEFEKTVVKPHKERIDELGKTTDQIVTMASIIEWEANIDDEKPIVSGLYWNRLNQNWRLQADPTVNYAIGERNRLYYSDYQIDHPYNTYRILGLPPGPITNPSYSSIYAALYPEEHEYMFMVASPEGGHVFTRTFDEHRQKSREWTRWLREQEKIKELNEAEASIEAESTN
ncbi:MAG: endolytic transglycosylase MltG [Balneolales bacterium]